MSDDLNAIEKTLEQQKNNREILRRLASEGKIPFARSMTRKERKEFAALECNTAGSQKEDARLFGQIQDKMFDWILDNVYDGFNFEEVSNDVCNALALYTYQLTYRHELSEKNF